MASETDPWADSQSDPWPNSRGSSWIGVAPDLLRQYAKSIRDEHIVNYSDYLIKISDVWEHLKLGWVGQTQKEADDFNARWHASAVALFGQKHVKADGSEDTSYPPPGENVLGKIGAVVEAVANNFALAQDTVIGMFDAYRDVPPRREDYPIEPEPESSPKQLPPSDVLGSGATFT